MEKIEKILGNVTSFVNEILEKLRKTGLDIDDFEIDHLCYRVENIQQYNKMKKEMMKFTKAYSEKIHHGRHFSHFILKKPLKIGTYEINVLELPSPKPDRHFKKGLEHLEMVVGSKFNEFVKKNSALWSGRDDSGPFNQPVFITFENGISVKFHQFALVDVLKMEKAKFNELT